MAIQLNLVGDLAIYQGETYEALTFHYPDNVSAWIPRGQIRRDYLFRQGVLLATFSFNPLIWAQVDIDGTLEYRTIVNPVLPDSVTANIPIHRVRTGSDFKPNNNCWVYDIELIDPSLSKTIKLARGFVEIVPGVTDE